MTQTTRYNVAITPRIQEGFKEEQVYQALGSVLKVPPEKAYALAKKQQVVKKGVDRKTALTYQKALAKTGVVVALKSLDPPADPTPAANADISTAKPAPVEEKPGVTCPKCQTRNPVGAVECENCGVIIEKARARLEAQQRREEGIEDDDEVEDEEKPSLTEGFDLKVIGAGVGAALASAVVWYLIAINLNVELGIIAWGVGGAIGGSVAAAGGSGHKTAVFCGVLALLAIFGGKMMIFSDLRNQVALGPEEIGEEFTAVMRGVYEMELATAKQFETVSGDESLRVFLIDQEYSYASVPDEVTQAEIDEFQASDGQRLSRMASSEPPDFETWYQDTITGELEEASTFDMVKADLGLLDILFLVLGVGTAFQLGRGW